MKGVAGWQRLCLLELGQNLAAVANNARGIQGPGLVENDAAQLVLGPVRLQIGFIAVFFRQLQRVQGVFLSLLFAGQGQSRALILLQEVPVIDAAHDQDDGGR